VTPNKKNPEPPHAYARGLQAQAWVVQPEDAHEPAPESQDAESLGPDIAAGRLGYKSKYRPAVRLLTDRPTD